MGKKRTFVDLSKQISNLTTNEKPTYRTYKLKNCMHGYLCFTHRVQTFKRFCSHCWVWKKEKYSFIHSIHRQQMAKLFAINVALETRMLFLEKYL